jgi:hypothetical protein
MITLSLSHTHLSCHPMQQLEVEVTAHYVRAELSAADQSAARAHEGVIDLHTGSGHACTHNHSQGSGTHTCITLHYTALNCTTHPTHSAHTRTVHSTHHAAFAHECLVGHCEGQVVRQGGGAQEWPLWEGEFAEVGVPLAPRKHFTEKHDLVCVCE